MSASRPPQHGESPMNSRDSQTRKGTQLLPPRPPLSATQTHHRQQQQHLRQRHRGELSSASPLAEVRSSENPRNSVWYHGGVDHPRPTNPDRAHVVSSTEESGSCNQEQPHGNTQDGRVWHAEVNEQSSLQQHPIVSTIEVSSLHVKGHSVLQSLQKHMQNPAGPHVCHTDAVEAPNITGAGKEKLVNSSVINSHYRDYRAALTKQISYEQPLSDHALKQAYEQPRLQNAMEDYFGCDQDGKGQSEGQSSGLDYSKHTEQIQQHYLDSSKHVEERLDVSSGDHTPNRGTFKDCTPDDVKEARHYSKKQSAHHVEKPSSQGFGSGDQVADDIPQPKSGTADYAQNPQQAHDYTAELSEASPDDSYFHVSKELVERDYQNECHLAASCTDQHRSGHVYDYSRAGVTLVEDSSKVAEEQQLDTDRCRNEACLGVHVNCNKECEEGSSHHEQADSQNDTGILEEQRQDVESPPLFLGFNQNSTRFAFGTSKGFRVYDVATMNECVSSMIGGVALVELLLCTNTVLLVGGGPNPSFPPNKAILWDGLRGAFCGELSQKFPILAVKVRRDRLVVVVENEVSIYNFSNAKLLFQVITTSNPRGISTISIKEGPSILAFPGLKKGEVRVEHIGTNRGREELPTRNSLVISAHDSSLACMALTLDGSLLATASDRGTLIRVFNTQDGAPLKEVRRGMDRAEIFSIAFSSSSDWLAVSSDKGTVHVFGLRLTGLKMTETDDALSTTIVKNPGSTLSFIKGVLPKYFSSEWSAAQFKLPQEMKSVVAFGQEKHSIFILGTDGSFFKCSFDPEHGGDMKQLEYKNFMKLKEAMV